MSPDEIAAVLTSEVIKTGTTNADAQRAMDSLRTLAELKLAKAASRLDNEKSQGVLDKRGNPLGNAQIFVCRWSDIRSVSIPPKLGYIPKVRKGGDSGGSLVDPSAVRSEYSADATLARYVNDYFYELLRAPFAPLKLFGNLLDRIDADYATTHRVVLSADFYYSRPIAQLGLHKDTTGTTLLVGLHYNNEDAMVGPEYIYDFWPIRPEPDESPDGSENYRQFAPWITDDRNGGVSFWPQDLIKGLETARAKLKKRHKQHDLVRVTTVPANGLVTFVDELIYHQTPLTSRRTTANADQFTKVTVSTVDYRLPQWCGLPKGQALRRTFSVNNMDTQWKDRATGRSGRRSFIRFWIMVEPKVWHVLEKDKCLK